MMPAVAQMAATLRTPVVPSRNACTRRVATGAICGRNRPAAAATANATKVAKAKELLSPKPITESTSPTAIAAPTMMRGTSAVSGRIALEPTANMVAQNTASTGEKPSNKKAMIEMSEPK